MKNSMHLDSGKNPFPTSHPAIKPKMAHSAACGPVGGKGDKISANASMRTKRPMQGTGKAG